MGLVKVFLFVLFTSATHAQDSQFLFDPNGNLFAQTAAVTFPPRILGQPQNRIVAPGEAASFSVVAVDTRALAYQWRFNGTNISGVTNDALLRQNVSTNHEGEYRVVLTNPSGSVTSTPAMLWIDSDADGQPDSWERLYFASLNQNATADFDGDGVSNQTEFLHNTNPTNRLSARFTLTVLNEGDGFVQTSPKEASYTNGQTVMLTATPPGTNLFYGWTGTIQSTNNPLLVTMASNTTVRAHFQFLPLDVVWTNLAGGDWHSATNWSPNQVPGALDNASIPITATVTIISPAECLGLTLGSVSGNPTLTGSGTLTVHGNLQWALGTMSGTGRTILETNTTANFPATVTLTARTLENRGTVLVYNTGGLNVTGGAVFTNCAGAVFHVVNENPSLGGGLANGRFDNAGTFVKSSGTGTLSLNNGLNFNNSGTVEIQTGILLCDGNLNNGGAVNISAGTVLRLAAGGSATGSFTAADGALVEWTGSTFAINPGTQFYGDGQYRINAGTLLANSDFAIKKLDLQSGTLGGAGAVTITNLMNWTGGTMSGSGRTIIPAGAVLNAALPSGGGLNARTLENAGTVLWTGLGNIGFVSAVITNRAGGMFHAQGGGGMTFVSGLNRFDNAGTFRKSVNPGALEIVDFSNSGSFNNFGTVENQAGTLFYNASFTNLGVVLLARATTNRMARGGLSVGTFNAPTTALVEWTGGTFTLNPGAQLTGPGRYRINGISANVVGNGDVTVQNFDLVNGSSTLSGTGALTIADIMNWTAGTMSGSGRTIIPSGATLILGSSGGTGLQRTLENGGTVLWTGAGTLGLLNGVITNRTGALFHAQNDARIFFAGGVGRFDNAGTVRKSVGKGTTEIGVSFANHGTVDIQSGVLAANGAYTSTSNALLNCAIGGTTAGANYGQLQVAGAITLNGALSVDFTNGFSPALNDSFTVLTAGTRSGVFASFFYPSNAFTMQVSNSPNSVVVRVTDVLTGSPAPLLLAPEISGSNFKLSWTTVSNITYRVEFNADLTPSNWMALPGDVIGLSNTASKLDSLMTSNRFYRVRVLP